MAVRRMSPGMSVDLTCVSLLMCERPDLTQFPLPVAWQNCISHKERWDLHTCEHNHMRAKVP